MISTSHSFLFIHRGKSGGNSLSRLLAPYSEDTLETKHSWQDGQNRFEVYNSKYETKKHFGLKQYIEVVPENILNKLFKFSIIRNPWDRMISAYFSPHRLDRLGISGFDEDNFLILVDKQRIFRDFVCINEFDELTKHLDFCIQFERFEEDIPKLLSLLNIPQQTMPHLNKSKRKDYHSYYNKRTYDAVAQKFSEEISYFGYSF